MAWCRLEGSHAGRRIRKISGGQVSLLAGDGIWGYKNGAGALAEFKDPYRIGADAAGNVYVLDQNNPHVRKITPNGDVSDYAGTDVPGFKDGDVSVAQFALDQGGITFDAQGNIYIDDTFNGRIRKISLAGQVSTFAGKETVGLVDGDTSVAEFQYVDGDGSTAQFNYPAGMAIDGDGNLYVADALNNRVRKIRFK